MLSPSTVWNDVYGFDYSCIKEIALREPLVDCVELRAVATNPCAIRHIDIRTVKKEDLAFDVPFKLKATRNDCKLQSAVKVPSINDCKYRHPCFPWLVRHFLLMLPQTHQLQHRSSGQGK